MLKKKNRNGEYNAGVVIINGVVRQTSLKS